MLWSVVYEVQRAYVVISLVSLVANIPEISDAYPWLASAFSFCVPTICGTIGGSGSVILSCSRGLHPFRDTFPRPVVLAFLGALFNHLCIASSGKLANMVPTSIMTLLSRDLTHDETGNVFIPLLSILYESTYHNEQPTAAGLVEVIGQTFVVVLFALVPLYHYVKSQRD